MGALRFGLFSVVLDEVGLIGGRALWWALWQSYFWAVVWLVC